MFLFVDYRYKGVGGGGQLVANTIFQLNKQGESAKVYCSQESYEYKRLINAGADFVYIDSGKVSLRELVNYVSVDDVILLTNINNTPLLEALKPLNNKLFFYSIFPDTFFMYYWLMDYVCNQKGKALELIESLFKKNALFFMDGPNVDEVIKRGACLNKNEVNYIPVPVMSYLDLRRNYIVNGNNFTITYIGRGNDDWKIYPIIKVLIDLNQSQVNARLIILTDSNARYEEMITSMVKDNKIPIEYRYGIYGAQLDKFLYDNSSLHISMGTSAMEGAKLGVPTILIDYSKRSFPQNYLYKWLFETIDYSLGREVNDGMSFSGVSLKSLINDLMVPSYYKRISDECYTYVNKFHSMEQFVENIKRARGMTNFTVSDYCATSFSKNMKNIQPVIIPIMEFGSKIKRNILKII